MAIPDKIKQLANDIRSKVYGREVRESLAKGIEEAGDLADKANTKSENAVYQVNNIQAQVNQLVVEGDSSVEAAQARVDVNNHSYSTLKERLDTEYSKVTSQLEDIEQEIENKADKAEVNILKKKLTGVKFSDLTEPMVFAHRGAKNIFPESSLEAYRACVDLGLPIELDIRMTADGTLVVNHDETVNRTTNRTGRLSNYSLAAFKSLNITELGTDFVGTPVTLQDLFIEFGNRAIYIIESKERDTAKPIVDLILKFNLEENVLFQSFNRDDLNYALQSGLQTMYLTDSADPATVKNDGIDYVGVSKDVSESYIAACLAAGLKVAVYTVNRRFEYDKFANLGVTAYFSDDPLWITSTSKVLTRDSFDQQTYYHGMSNAENENIFGNRGEFVPPGKFGWSKAIKNDEMPQKDFILQGWAGMLPDNFELKFDIFPSEYLNYYEYLSIALCTPIDYFDDYSEISSGYHIVFRQSGVFDLYVVRNGAAELLSRTETGVELVKDRKVSVTINVFGDNITVERTDEDYTGVIHNISNDEFRNGYLHIGRRLMGGYFGNMKLYAL